jgi:DNA polymerase-3 subunit alpha
MEYSTYFLIVWDFVRYARENGISVGPGRGSAAGSLVSYALRITNVDPLKYGLIFERFLNPDRISLPDFDIDFCIRGRDDVIEYVRRRYGGDQWWERIAQIATYDRMAARSVVRDVGRVLGFPFSVPDRVAKLIPFGWGLKAAVDRVSELKALYEGDPQIKRLIDIGRRLEGLTRNASTHAAGLVIAPDLLSNHVPLLRLGEGEFVTQFDMIDVEAVGLLKFDFLGLRNLTLIEETRESLKTFGNIDLCLETIPLDDDATFALISEGRTAGIFQLESSGMTSLIRRVQPNRFEDLVALLALYRPGPLESGMTDEYVERRGGRVQVTYPHPSLAPILEDTYGLPIYQDQVMKMAQTLAGFTLAEADILRKAMGKKDKAIMESLRTKFIDGCLTNGFAPDLAEKTFSDMEKFSRYGFGKSHTTAYAFVSYWTAYLKANHPTHFMAALLTSVQADTDKVAEYIGECRDLSIDVLPPDINESRHGFAPVEDGKIRFGLGAIKHVGRGAISAIVRAREGGPFVSFFDMCRRIEDDGLDREALEALVKAGAFDRLGASRRGLLRHLSEGIEMMHRTRHERQTGQQSIFATLDDGEVDPIVREDEFEQPDLLAFERELLGLYVTAHPLDDHREALDFYCLSAKEAKGLAKGDTGIVGGRVKKIRRIDTKRGDPMAFVTVEDGVDEVEVTVFPRVLEASTGLLREDALIGIAVTADARNGEVGLIANEVLTLDDVSNRMTLALLVTIETSSVDPDGLSLLQSELTQHAGDAPVWIQLVDPLGSIHVRAHDRFSVAPSDELRATLTSFPGIVEAEFRSKG